VADLGHDIDHDLGVWNALKVTYRSHRLRVPPNESIKRYPPPSLLQTLTQAQQQLSKTMRTGIWNVLESLPTNVHGPA
jgi:hypothetical protein